MATIAIVIQGEIVFVGEIKVNEDSMSVNTVAEPFIFLVLLGKIW